MLRQNYILDAYGLLYQLFHALPPMNSPQGEPVAAVYGFVKDIFGIIERYQPDCLFCAFDLPGLTFRSELFAEYKANRSEMPDDLKPQIGFACEILEALGIPALSLPGYEADDIIATICRLAEERQERCVIVTNDKDCRQLISGHVSLLNLRKHQFYRAENLYVDWGIRPEQVIDFQALVGDPADNVPGIPLIGQKIASELLQKYGTLEGVLEHTEDISGAKRRENIRNGKDTALLSRQLVRLNSNVPVPVDWSDNLNRDEAKLKALCERFGFKPFLTKERAASLF